MDINQNIRNEINEYLYNYEEGFSTQQSINAIVTLLSEASQDVKNNTLNYAAKVGEPELVDIIINNGGDVNSVTEGRTPLMAAIIDPDNQWDKQKSIVETLLDRGANPSEVVDGKSVDEEIDSEINKLKGNNNREDEIETLESIKEMINQRIDRIEGGKRKRKRTKKNKKTRKRKSMRTKKRTRKSVRRRKHRK